MEGPATVNAGWPNIKRVPEATYFPADAEWRDERLSKSYSVWA